MTNITFNELDISANIKKAISDMGFETPTEIQAKAIPLIKEGSDIIGRSHTGTGKTVAFGIPAVDCIEGKDTQVLVICPTRELAMQAADEMRKIAKYTENIKTVCVYGGQPIQSQISQLKRGAEIVIGTPGRIIDHVKRKTLRLEKVKMVVLDEADEMLDMGFREDIESILSFVPNERQTLLFSATMPDAIMEITNKYQTNPVVIKAGNSNEKTMDTIEQYYYNVPRGKKPDALSLLLYAHNPKLCIIFVNTKKMTEELSRHLGAHGFNASPLHGDMKQEARTAVMQSFKQGKTPILIATDVAARGIDVNNVDAVYNYDLPQDFEYYVHRIGRTGRAGKLGASHTLVCGRREAFSIKEIQKYTKAEIIQKPLPNQSDIIERKQEVLMEEILTQIEKDKELNPLVKKMIDNGTNSETLCSALMNILIKRETINIPNVEHESRKVTLSELPSGYIRLRFSVGRNQRVAPNHIVAAISSMTRIPGKQIEKINCFGDYSLAEVPSKYKNLIISKVSGNKIGGYKTDVRIYSDKDTSDNRRHNKSAKSGGHFSANKRNAPRSQKQNNRPYPNRRKPHSPQKSDSNSLT